MSLMFLIPVDWSLLVSGLKFMLFGLSYVFGYVIMGASIIKMELDVPSSQWLLLFWLCLLSFWYVWVYKDQIKVKKRTGSRRQKSCRFRRKSLPFFLVI